MRLPFHTVLLEVRREVRAIQEWVLPQPVPVVPFVVFLLSSAVLFELVHRLGLPFNIRWGWLYVLAPVVLAKLSDRPLVEGKPLHLWLRSQISYPFQPRRICRLLPMREPVRVRLSLTAWQQSDTDRHSWLATGSKETPA